MENRIKGARNSLLTIWIAPVILFSIFYFLFSTAVFAQTADDLQSKIDQRNSDIASLEKEIAGYQKQIDSLGTQELSLSETLKSLDLTQRKLETNIKVTQDKIDAKTLEIQKLGNQIVGKQGDIEDDHRIIASSFTAMSSMDTQSLPEILLGSKSLSDAWDSLDQLAALQGSVYDRIGKLRSDEATLTSNKTASEKAKGELVALNNDLINQRKVVVSTVAEKNELLSQTKQSESSYKQQLASKKALMLQFENELLDYESQLHLVTSSTVIPHPGSGILSWPVDVAGKSIDSVITQYFGNTPFATANPQVYNGMGHNGIDLRASIGTPIKSALGGIVIGVANTDLVPNCYSFGKWVMVKHPNGLSTLYAHLSLQSVSIGQHVETGQIIGYSGNTGYTTGPHLHFGVYATDGVLIEPLPRNSPCKGATMPIADLKAYLNPLSYL